MKEPNLFPENLVGYNKLQGVSPTQVQSLYSVAELVECNNFKVLPHPAEIELKPLEDFRKCPAVPRN